MNEFEALVTQAPAYTLAQSLDQAMALMADGRARVVGGCTDFFPTLQKGAPVPPLVDVSRVKDMCDITTTSQGWRIGGAVTWRTLIDTPLPAAFNGLKAAAREVGSVQIQNVGTVAGNICNASPAADGVPALLTLDAQVEIRSAQGLSLLPLSRFLTGPRQTALRPGELVAALIIPPLPDHATSHFEKLGSREYLVISIAMVAAVVALNPEGRVSFARVAVGACSAVAQRQFALETALLGQRPEDIVVTPDHLENLSPIADVRGSAEYRLDAAAHLSTRVIKESCQ